MKKLEEIQQQLAIISEELAILQQEKNTQEKGVYKFTEEGLKAVIEAAITCAIEAMINSVDSGDVSFDQDCVDVDLDGWYIECTIDNSMIATALQDIDVEDLVDIDDQFAEAINYHSMEGKYNPVNKRK